MGIFRSRDRPLSSRRGSKEPSAAARGCISLFLIVWGVGFGGGGLAVLISESGPDSMSWWLRCLFATPFMIGGLVAIAFGLAIAFGVPLGRGRARGVDRTTRVGPRTLRPTHRRGCVLLFLVPFTGTWVAVSAALIASTGREEGPPWFFGVIFGAVTLGLVAATVHQLLALANPRAEIDLEVDELGIGAQTTLAWRLSGNANRLTALTIELIGREEASYTRGTDRVTDRNEFYRRVLAHSDVVLAGPRGTIDVRLPENAVPSFASSSNKIVWLLRFSAPIRRWPDVKDEIELPVGPGARHGGETP